MTALSSLAALLLCAAPSDVVLVQFSSPQCPHCKTMEPVIARLSQAGCSVQMVDVSQQPEVAQQFRVTGVPTYVALNKGRETGRVVGAASYEKLAEMVQGTVVRGQEPAAGPESGVRGQMPGDRSQGPGSGNQVGGAGVEVASAATVRIKVEDATGFGFGTGTIIDIHENEALVVTCGHLFRESQGKGTITADLFTGGTQTCPGQLIAYDLDKDIALMSVRVPPGVRPAPVAGPGQSVRPGDRVFTIGCDKGANPSLRQTQITAVNKYRGRPNYTAAGQPVDGRSGGGLFTADGLLIGICNAADPADDEGLYAGLAAIHWQLDQIGQSEVYQRNARAVAAANPPQERAVVPAAALAATPEPAALPELPARMPASSSPPAAMAPERAAPPAARSLAAGIEPITGGDDDTEIVFIVRSKRDPQKQSEIFLVDQPPPDLMAQIVQAARSTGEQRAAMAQTRSAGGLAQRRPNPYPPAGTPPIVRGQSGNY